MHQRSIEDLNLKGAAADDPPFTDSILGADSHFRRLLFQHGLLFRMGANAAYIQNTLAAPVAANTQNYTGQREFGSYSLNPVLTADLRQFGLWKSQLNINGQLQQSSWDPAQPEAWTISSLYLYKEFGEDRVEIKVGYLTTDFQFIGLQVGGQVASGAQGVYAVLPYEVGISYSPVPAPVITLKYRFDSGLYLKGAAQRAAQPGSEQDALKRDAVGLRFLPHGDKLVLVGEAGIKNPPAAGKLERWYRAGYIANNTPYTSLRTGLGKSGNYCGYLLADHQVWQPEQSNPGRGIYLGGSAMVVPADLNIYRLYYEARTYYAAPFHSRPNDFASVVGSYTAFSQDELRNLAAADKSHSRASDSVTGSYTARLLPGTYVGLGLSYVNGPAVTPKVPAALTFTAQTSVFF
ncbi:MAG TPA: carbohydrate porin [Terracidiphilus sp.]|nr:carbohydrate porin [Terracidiphilus sp.]